MTTTAGAGGHESRQAGWWLWSSSSELTSKPQVAGRKERLESAFETLEPQPTHPYPNLCPVL